MSMVRLKRSLVRIPLNQARSDSLFQVYEEPWNEAVDQLWNQLGDQILTQLWNQLND